MGVLTRGWGYLREDEGTYEGMGVLTRGWGYLRGGGGGTYRGTGWHPELLELHILRHRVWLL